MDPSIMKLLEEDEDESMHSGADVEAFTAALNRDIESGTLSTQPSQAETTFSQENNQSSGQMYSQWQPSKQTDYSANQSQQSNKPFVDQYSSKVDAKEHNLRIETKQEVNSTQEPSRFHMQYTSMQGDGLGHEVEQNLAQYSRSLASTQMQMSGSAHPQIPEQHRVNNLGSGSQLSNMQRLGNNQPVPVPEQVGASTQMQNQISFGSLLPIILPVLDKDRAMQLQTLYTKLRRNQIPKDGFVRQMKTLVGDQIVRLAVVKLQAKSQNPSQQQRAPPDNSTQFADPYSFGQLAGGPSRGPVVSVQPYKDSGCQPVDNRSLNSGEMQHITGSHGLQANELPGRSTVSVQGLSKQQQEHLHFSQGSFPKYGGQPISDAHVNSPCTMAKQVHDPQIRHSQLHQGFCSAPVGGTGQVLCNNVPKVERQNSYNDTKSVTAPTMPNMPAVTMHYTSVPRQGMASKEQKLSALPPKDYVKQEPSEQAHDKQPKASLFQSQGLSFSTTVQVEQGKVPVSLNDELSEKQNYGMAFTSSTRTTNMTTSSSTQINVDTQVGSQSAGISKTSTKKPIGGQKQPIDALASSPPLPSKKQKVSGVFADQSIEHLNDVTAVSGVNLREEEEQLFTLPKDDNKVLEASRKMVQEEEDRLILQKRPLQKKLAEIMTKFGLKNLSNDVERCLSLCVEERLRALISSLIRVSKQRADSEKSKHSTVVTSDVRKQILVINQKAREEWEKKQAEADKLRKQNQQPDSSAAVDIDKEKDDARNKSLKVNKDQDDKMRTTAANVAARAAVGGDDMLSKWLLMAKARQKHDGGFETASSTQEARESNLKQPLSTFTGNVNDTRDHPTALATAGAMRQACKHQARKPPPSVAPSISLKDVIAVLEREPQMARSTLLYRLYDRLHVP